MAEKKDRWDREAEKTGKRIQIDRSRISQEQKVDL